MHVFIYLRIYVCNYHYNYVCMGLFVYLSVLYLNIYVCICAHVYIYVCMYSCFY